MYEALKAGGPTPFTRYPTIATGLAPPTAGTWYRYFFSKSVTVIDIVFLFL